MRIYHNIPALYAYNSLNETNSALEKSIKSLSTGLRINSAADDAAGLAISEKMRAQISGLNMAVRNAQDGISLLQTAEGALAEDHSILQRMRELAVQAANDTLTQQDRQYIQQEIDQLKDEVSRIASTTQFNKKKLLDGSAAGLWSSNNLSTKAYIRGSLRQVDQFGQKAAFEGNYRISVSATPGQAEAQKSDIFKIKHKNVIMGVGVNTQAGVSDVRVDNLPAGTYSVSVGDKDPVTTTVGYNFVPGDEPASPPATLTLAFNTATMGTLGNENDEISVTAVSTFSAVSGGTVTFDVSLRGTTQTVTLTAAGGAVTVTVDGTSFTMEMSAVTSSDWDTDFGIGSSPLEWTYEAITPVTVTQDWENVALVGRYGYSGPGLTFSANNSEGNASILMEVIAVNTSAGTVTFRATSNVLSAGGGVYTFVDDELLLDITDIPTYTKLGIRLTDLSLGAASAQDFEIGDKLVYNVIDTTGDVLVQISGTQTDTWDYRWGDAGESVTLQPLQYGVNADAVAGQEVHFRNFYLNTANGTVYEGNIVLTLDDKFSSGVTGVLATFEAGYIGQVAKSDVRLQDIDKFWDSQGRFLLTDPQTITISQGDGKNTSVTLYSTDTMAELQKKLNDAIANGLGQAQFAVSDANRFVSFVEQGSAHPNTVESVAGTLVIRSMVAGNAGKLSFSGDEELIKALSLNVVQESKENAFTVSVYDAHSGSTVASGVKISGNMMVGVIHPNVDVEFDPMANIEVKWNSKTRTFDLTKKNEVYETILHLVDNSTVFQVGANEGENVAVDIGNMTADALGITRVIVTDRESASRAITILDSAISKISTQRAKIGAYQNTLEHTITNLTTTSTNLTSAESRIRDADMSQEMLNFTRLQILSQSGTAMLAQANQLPQSVLSLIRG